MLKKAKDSMDDIEFELLLDSIDASNELAMGIVNESRLEKINKVVKHINKHQKQYMMITSVTLFLIASGAMSFALPTMSMATTVINSTTVACSLPNFSMGNASAKIGVLITNLIKLGVLATVASCVFEMLKQIVEGSINKLPKTLITHAMMCCSVLLAPTVFNYISGVFGMGQILGSITTTLL